MKDQQRARVHVLYVAVGRKEEGLEVARGVDVDGARQMTAGKFVGVTVGGTMGGGRGEGNSVGGHKRKEMPTWGRAEMKRSKGTRQQSPPPCHHHDCHQRTGSR